jgi:hypothetical protein
MLDFLSAECQGCGMNWGMIKERSCPSISQKLKKYFSGGDIMGLILVIVLFVLVVMLLFSLLVKRIVDE